MIFAFLTFRFLSVRTGSVILPVKNMTINEKNLSNGNGSFQSFSLQNKIRFGFLCHIRRFIFYTNVHDVGARNQLT